MPRQVSMTRTYTYYVQLTQILLHIDFPSICNYVLAIYSRIPEIYHYTRLPYIIVNENAVYFKIYIVFNINHVMHKYTYSHNSIHYDYILNLN